jgi:hypothetical protein
MKCTHLLSLSLLLGVAFVCPPVQAEDLSLKVENYIFAASEALEDGEPALALSLLRRARSEAPESCIVEEYLCRCYLALGNPDMARASYGRFVACMDVTDEGVLMELDALLAEMEAQPPAPPAPTPEEPVAEAPAMQPAPALSPAPEPGRAGGGWFGWTLMGTGLAVSAGAGVASYVTGIWGEHYVEKGDQTSYEDLLPYNHAAVYGAYGGGALAVTGLVVGLVSRNGRNVSAAPWVPPQGLGLSAQVEF